MIKFIKSALTLLFTAISFLVTQNIHAGGAYTSGTGTNPYASLNFWFSYELVTFTRGSQEVTVTDENGTRTVIVPGPLFDVTEPDITTFVPEACAPAECAAGVEKLVANGSALLKGTLPVSHGPAPELGSAWADVQLVWPTIKITIYRDDLPNGCYYNDAVPCEYVKESRKYEVTLESAPTNNDGKLINGYKRIVPELGTDGVYMACDPEDTLYDAFDYLCYQELGYGEVAFDPSVVFKPSISASGQEISANHGFYMDDVCTGLLPEVAGVTGTDLDLKIDTDGYVRLCEGQSVAFNSCSKPDATAPWDCERETSQGSGQYFTLSLANAVAGDRIIPFPTAVCIGTEVSDWLKLADYALTDVQIADGEEPEPITIYPCDPLQDRYEVPTYFSSNKLIFTQSEGDGKTIKNIYISNMTTASPLGTYSVIQESADKSETTIDAREITFDGVTVFDGLELSDTLIGSAGSDVLLGGNGPDTIYGWKGKDCLDGKKNDGDELWGDGLGAEPEADVFVISKSLGADTIMDFDENDVIVNNSRYTVNTNSFNYDDIPGSTIIELSGQNKLIVKDAIVDINDIKDDLSAYPQCNGYY